MKKLKLGSKVLYRGAVHTLLGYTKSGTSCVIEGPEGKHSGDVLKYWHDEYGKPIAYTKKLEDNRYFVAVAETIPCEQSEPEFIFNL
jgi:hypothetical protein